MKRFAIALSVLAVISLSACASTTPKACTSKDGKCVEKTAKKNKADAAFSKSLRK